MIAIDEQTLRSIISMKSKNADFQAFIEWLTTVRAQMEQKSIRQKDVECHWSQGKAQGFGDLLNIIEKSEEMLADRRQAMSQPEGVVA